MQRLARLKTHRHRRLLLGLAAGLFLLALLVVGLWPTGSPAAAPQSGEAGLGLRQDGPDGALDWPALALDVSLKLLLVLGLLYLVLLALRRYGLGVSGQRRRGEVEVLDATTLAPNRGLYLVRVRERTLLLGVTQTQISTLADLGVDPDSVSRSEPAVSAPGGQPRFEDFLR